MTGRTSDERPSDGHETPDRAAAPAPESEGDASRKGRFRLRAILALGRDLSTPTGALRAAALALGIVASVLLVIAELAPVYTIEVSGLPCEPAEPELAEECEPSGADRHSYALFVLALLALVMALGAGLARSLPAAAALALTGLAVLAIVLIGDAPHVNETGAIGLRFEEAAAMPGSGFWLSLAGGAAALLAGAAGLAAAFVRR